MLLHYGDLADGSQIARILRTIQPGEVVSWKGSYEYDISMPDGVMQKLLDVTQLADLGWTAKISLREGIASTYRDFLSQSLSEI